MRASITILGISTLAAIAGCATNTASPTTQPAGGTAITAQPSDDELPVYDFAEDVLPANIGIEDIHPTPVRQLVFLEPELTLTPEEEKALGIKKPQFDPLEFYRPAPSIDTPQWPFDHRLNATVYGIGGSGARPYGTAAARVGIAENASWGATFSGPPSNVTGVYDAGRPFSAPVGLGGVSVSDGPRSSTGSHVERSKP